MAGNRCELLRDGVEAFPEMLDAIRSAKRFVRLETYMFIDDAVGQLFGRVLAEASARGVKVTVLFDALGSWKTHRAFVKQLRAQGVNIRAFKPFSLARGFARLFYRDHRKLLIVDAEIAFVGGVNIAAQWAPRGHLAGEGWRDDVVRIEGPVVQQLERRFCATWRMQVKERLRRRRAPLSAASLLPKGEVTLSVLSSRRSIHRAYVRAIERASARVMIAAAYFVPDRKMLSAIRRAAARGVEVSLILAGKSDHPWIRFATRAFYARLLRAGVRVFEWSDGVLHSKTAVVDGTWATVGSFNLERTSLRLNHEVNVVWVNPRCAKALERSFLSDCVQCKEITVSGWAARPLWHKVMERLTYHFRRII
ncbi:MAG: cardiolipin synthase ClsB [Myxococcaceae bacterium]